MKFSHLKLEQIRHNPAAAKEILAGQDGGRLSMNRVWYFAARKFHQSGNDKNFAMNYFDELFDKRFVINQTNRQKKEGLLLKLDRYIENYNKLGFEFYDCSNRISIDIEHGNIISGEIFRFDRIFGNKYVVTILDKEDSIWAKELRYPLFQIHFSNVFNCPAENIRVGVYDFLNEEHEYITYDELSLKTSQDEIKAISTEINNSKL